MPNFSYYSQMDQMDCGPTCLRMVAKHFGKHYSAQTLREQTRISREGVSMLGIAEAAESLGFSTVGVKLTIDKLINEVPLPCILHWGQNHFVVLYKIGNLQSSAFVYRFLRSIWKKRSPYVSLPSDNGKDKDTYKESIHEGVARDKVFFIADPAFGLLNYNSAEFGKKWLSGQSRDGNEGIALLFEPTPRFYREEDEKLGTLKFTQLLEYVWQYKKLVVQLGIGMLAGSGLSLLFPFLTQSVVDVGIGTQNLPFVYLVLIAQMVLLLSSASVDFLRSWILLHISTRLNLTILSEFLSKLMRLPVSFFDVKQFGDIMQRIGDHQRIESFLTGATLSVLFSLLNFFVFGFILSWYNIPIFLVALGASCGYVGWVVMFLKQRGRLDARRFIESSQNQSQIVQLIQGMQDIKLAGAETTKRWEWERTQSRLFKWNVRSLSLSQFQQAGALFINNGKNIFITFLAAKAVLDGQLTLGGMMSIQYILGQFNSPIEQMIGFLQSWQDAKISLERLNEVHDLTDEEPIGAIKRTDWDKTQDLRIDQLSYTYPGAGNEPVLRNVNLTIPYGKTTAIVGTSGSGKTTLLKILLRFYEPQEGTISLVKSDLIVGQLTPCMSDKKNVSIQPGLGRGTKLTTLSHRAWRKQCGVVMQDGFIFSDSIARNIAVSDEIIDEEKLYKAAMTANIHSFIESLPLGYHTKIGAEGNGISQGQKQRILIARAVYKDPHILLFDEATNALDANNEALIMRNLQTFFQNRTVIVVAHRLSTVKKAEQILVMEKGEIVERGTHSDLVELKGNTLNW